MRKHWYIHVGIKTFREEGSLKQEICIDIARDFISIAQAECKRSMRLEIDRANQHLLNSLMEFLTQFEVDDGIEALKDFIRENYERSLRGKIFDSDTVVSPLIEVLKHHQIGPRSMEKLEKLLRNIASAAHRAAWNPEPVSL